MVCTDLTFSFESIQQLTIPNGSTNCDTILDQSLLPFIASNGQTQCSVPNCNTFCSSRVILLHSHCSVLPRTFQHTLLLVLFCMFPSWRGAYQYLGMSFLCRATTSFPLCSPKGRSSRWGSVFMVGIW